MIRLNTKNFTKKKFLNRVLKIIIINIKYFLSALQDCSSYILDICSTFFIFLLLRTFRSLQILVGTHGSSPQHGGRDSDGRRRKSDPRLHTSQ